MKVTTTKNYDFTNFEIVMNKLKNSLHIENDKDMAQLLGITPSTYSQRAARNSIPYEKIFEICLNNGISINYIFGVVNEFKNHNLEHVNSINIKKYFNYNTFGNDIYSEPFSFTNEFCDDYPDAKLSAVVADNIHMFPVIDINDIVIVNENDKKLLEDAKMFLVKYKGNVSATRLFKCIDPDEVVMKFESPVHDDTKVKLKNLTILGKVISIHRSMV